MQFAYLNIDGVAAWAFVLAKAEVLLLVNVCNGKRAPEDEQVVRFACYDERPTVWASNGEQLVFASSERRHTAPESAELNVLASDIKPLVTKASVKQRVSVMLDGRVVLLEAGEYTGLETTPQAVTSLAALGTCLPVSSQHLQWGRPQLTAVYSGLRRDHTYGAPVWRISAQCAATIADIGSLVGEGELVWCTAPPNDASPLVVEGKVDATVWTAAIMPRVKSEG